MASPVHNLLLRLFLCLVLLGVGKIQVLADWNATVDDLDSRITWGPSVCDAHTSACADHSWTIFHSNDSKFAGGTVHSAMTADLNMEFSFRGSAIHWFTSSLSTNGSAFVTVDGDLPVTVFVPSDVASTSSQLPIFTRQGLDPTKCHTIALKIASNARVDVDFFTIVLPDTTLNSSSGVDCPLASSAVPSSSPHAPLQGALIAGVVVGGILIVLAAVVLFVLHRRWKVHALVSVITSANEHGWAAHGYNAGFEGSFEDRTKGLSAERAIGQHPNTSCIPRPPEARLHVMPYRPNRASLWLSSFTSRSSQPQHHPQRQTWSQPQMYSLSHLQPRYQRPCHSEIFGHPHDIPLADGQAYRHPYYVDRVERIDADAISIPDTSSVHTAPPPYSHNRSPSNPPASPPSGASTSSPASLHSALPRPSSRSPPEHQ